MPDSLVTVATATTPLEAELIRGRLERDGFTVFVSDAGIVTADWSTSNAIGGVKVRVPAPEAEGARALLAEPPPEGDEPYEPPTPAEDLAHRALSASVLGLGLPPLQLYALYLLTRYAAVASGETPRTRRKAVWALVFMLPWAALIAVLVAG